MKDFGLKADLYMQKFFHEKDSPFVKFITTYTILHRENKLEIKQSPWKKDKKNLYFNSYTS
jgi:hypothetical protein